MLPTAHWYTEGECTRIQNEYIVMVASLLKMSYIKGARSELTRALKRTEFLETLSYDATTTRAVLSSIARTLSEVTPTCQCVSLSPISSLIM